MRPLGNKTRIAMRLLLYLVQIWMAWAGSLCALLSAILVLPALLERVSLAGKVPERSLRMFRSVLIILSILVLSLGVFDPVSAETPTERVKAVLDKAMEIQTREDLAGDVNQKERARMIRMLISENFLSTDMARESIKDNWDKLSQKQKSEFQGLFINLFQDSYTRMVLNFLQKETIEYRGESPDDKGVLVKTVIMRANEHIPVDYHLLQKGGRWYIHDVDIDGVSIIENYRNSFKKALQSGSFDALLERMRLQSEAIRD